MKADGSLVTLGDRLVNKKLGATFRAIQSDPMTFYNGSLARDIVDDIQERG
jgi:gamma-glutamyltranspeptidase